VTEGTLDKLSAILALTLSFPTVLRVVGLSCHPAEEIPPRKLRVLIAARGDATGLPMDRTKSRALCNPPSSAPSLATIALNIHPGPSCPRGAGCTRSFQFARVVHSTGDRKILGEENFFLFYSLPPLSSLFIILIFFFIVCLLKHIGVESIHLAVFRLLYRREICVQYMYNKE